MTPATDKAPRRVTLSHQDIEDILVWRMGWEHIDVTSFWSEARRIERKRTASDQ